MKEFQNNFDRSYLNLVTDILENGSISGDRTGTGTQKVFGRMIRHDMSEGAPILTSKFVHTKGVITELLWFLSGDTNIKYLVDRNVYIWVGDCYKKYLDYCSKMEEPETEYLCDDLTQGKLRPFTRQEFIDYIKRAPSDYKNHLENWKFSSANSILSHFVDKFAELGTVYGKEWVDWNGINQIQKAVDTLKNNPNSRRILITAWNPEHIENVVLPPCHYSFQLQACELSHTERLEYLSTKVDPIEVLNADEDKINLLMFAHYVPKHKLSLMFNMRSVDIPLGVPYNLASYGFLLSMFAQQCNMIPADLIASLGDTHIYLNQIHGIKIQLQNPTFKLPTLKLKKADSIFSYKIEDFEIENYQNAGKVEMPLSN